MSEMYATQASRTRTCLGYYIFLSSRFKNWEKNGGKNNTTTTILTELGRTLKLLLAWWVS